MEKKISKEKSFLSKSYSGLGKLGKGTYGSVYKAQRKQTNEIIAIKKIKLDVDSEGIPSTALREISILKKMTHPNILRLNNKYKTFFVFSSLNILFYIKILFQNSLVLLEIFLIKNIFLLSN